MVRRVIFSLVALTTTSTVLLGVVVYKLLSGTLITTFNDLPPV